MKNNLSVRLANAKDIPLIRSIAEDVWPPTYAPILTKPQISYMMEMMYSKSALEDQMNTGHRFIIVYSDEIPMGFASYSQIEPGVYKLHKIYVSIKNQGTGAGNFLLNYIIKDLRDVKASALLLNVNRNNKAKGFYEKKGFRTVKTEDIDIGNGFYMNDYVMKLDI